jgi:RNA polymerase sigma-70 factor (ECF subfamily)
MSNILLVHTTSHAQGVETSMAHDQPTHAALLNNIDTLLETARPRLVRLARLHGAAPAAADDIAQETLLAAWRSLNHLRAPERFDAWLDGICRNMCRRWASAQRETAEQTRPLGALWSDDERSDVTPDPLALDPAEELDRQDLEVLLDRALGHLPANAREALELCYLAELPQREAALRLGLTIGALELRLHRARKQLRQLLSGALRPDAEAFGLLPDDEPSTGWRESREWCNQCGRQRLRGVFEPMPDGRINFRMRCPVCSPHHDIDTHDSGGWIEFGGLRSFHPARKRLIQSLVPRQRQTIAGNGPPCRECQQPIRALLLHSDEMNLRVPPNRFYSVMVCSNHHDSMGWAGVIAGWGHALFEDFWTRHPRWITEPDMLTEYRGIPALRFRMADLASASRLTLFAQYPTLRVLAAFQE